MSRQLQFYVYIAANEEGGSSFAGTARSLLDMPWIVEFGVDALMWFEGCKDEAQAEAKAAKLAAMTEGERQAVFLAHNPERADLSPRIWASDPD